MVKKFTIEQVSLNDGKNGNPHWLIIQGKVYDVTGYDHPGGIEVFNDTPNTEDKFDEFESIGHSASAVRIMQSFYIGDLE